LADHRLVGQARAASPIAVLELVADKLRGIPLLCLAKSGRAPLWRRTRAG
jgi:hypothetical protein